MDDARRIQLRGREGALVRNMESSLTVPTATTIKQFGVGTLQRWRSDLRTSGVDVPLISVFSYALVRTVAEDAPAMCHRFEREDSAAWRVVDGQVNLGIAVDVSSASGSFIMVPVVHAADSLTFSQLSQRIEVLARACRDGSIAVEDLKGANIILTSTGKFGSTGGIPRLPVGPGSIIAIGRIGAPAGLEDVSPALGIQPVVMMTSTYDHRVVQGSDSGTLVAGLARRLQDGEFLNSMAVPPRGLEDGPRDREPVAQALASVPHLTVEWDHLPSADQRDWWKSTLSSAAAAGDVQESSVRTWALDFLADVAVWERFLQRQFLGLKTLSVEGIDTSILALAEIARRTAARQGLRVEVGMAHRGRLALMATVLNWPLQHLLREFLPDTVAGEPGFVGDVRQHLGGTGVFTSPDGSTVEVLLEQNPSHLEFVGPVALGAARAFEDRLVATGLPPEQAGRAVVPVLLHGDAAFTGQGVVYETLNLSRLRPYRTGGVIHIVQDNQLGFTASGEETRSTQWPSDMARGFGLPVIRSDADDVDAVLAATSMAYAFRETFGTDVLLHIVGYRRHGHNETDEPRYTQPAYYRVVDEREPIAHGYARTLSAEGVVSENHLAEREKDYGDRLAQALASAKQANEADPATSVGRGEPDLDSPAGIEPHVAESAEDLVTLIVDSYTVPDGFTLNAKLEGQFARKIDALRTDRQVDWAQAEWLALALLSAHGLGVRLTGEDTERGTFSHRHLVLHDVVTGERFTRSSATEPRFLVANSPLTETATLAFEYGYARERHDAIAIWEAQFGDFVNVAQVITDQFISAGRSKWFRDGRLVLLLPHGWEGAGPEHSSARLERFLALGAQGNLRVLYPTDSLQYFAALMEAGLGPIRPTVIMTPKSQLRAASAAASVDDFTGAVRFAELKVHGPLAPDVDRVILCSGKIGTEVLDAGVPSNVAVIRLEQLYPFPARELAELLDATSAREVVWVQEEPENMGAWRFVSHELLKGGWARGPLGYVGRPESASPAEGYSVEHKREQARICAQAAVCGAADYWLVR